MKKRILALAAATAMGISLFAGCGARTTEEKSAAVAASGEGSAEAAQESEVSEVPKDDRPCIEDIAWSVDEAIEKEKRVVFLSYDNNSPYSICEFRIQFTEKDSVTEEKKEKYFTEVQEITGATEEDMEEIKARDISMSASSKRLVKPGESESKGRLHYYSGVFYMNSMEHYELVEPDTATIKYIKDGNIYTTYYDFRSGKYSDDDEYEEAYQWPEGSELAEMISAPETELLYLKFDRDDLFKFEAYGIDKEASMAYVEDCKEKGFNVDIYDSSIYILDADNADGYGINIGYDADNQCMEVEIREH